MKVVIMAGGKGTRISSVASDIPKPMIKIEGKPVLEHEIECLRDQGFKDIILTVSHLGNIIMEYFGDGSGISPVTGKNFGVHIEYYFEKEPLGNAGALFKIKNKLTDDFLLLNADAMFDVDFNRFVDFHKKHGGLVTLFTHPNSHPLKSIEQSIIDAYLVMEECYENGGKLLIAGNGGSAADSEHIAGELMKRFKTPRPVKKEFADKLIAIDPERGTQLANNLECSLMAIPLVAHEALTTAYINDVDGLGVFAQQLFGFGRKGDVFLGISTSGNSKNVIPATVVARALGIKVIGLTGANGGELAKVADVAVKAPENETYMVQELHLPIYHCWCLMLEDKFFG